MRRFVRHLEIMQYLLTEEEYKELVNGIESERSRLADTPLKADYPSQDAYLRIISANSVCRDGRYNVTRSHIVCDENRDELCACETESQAVKIAAAFEALKYIATLKTDQLASAEQCSAVAVAMDALSLPNAQDHV